MLSCCLDSNRRVYVEDSRVFETFRGGCNDTKHLPKKSALLQSKVAISITVKFYKVIQMCTPDFLTDLRGLIYRLLHTFTASHCCGENIHQTRAGIPRSGNMYHPESKNISQANPAISRSTCYQNFYFQQK